MPNTIETIIPGAVYLAGQYVWIGHTPGQVRSATRPAEAAFVLDFDDLILLYVPGDKVDQVPQVGLMRTTIYHPTFDPKRLRNAIAS